MLSAREREVLREWDDFAKSVPSSVEGRRDGYARYSEGLNRDLPQIAAYDEGVELRPGTSIHVAVPRGRSLHPVLLYIHGGSWISGSARTHRGIAMEFARLGYLTFNLDYRLAPEHPFPAGFDDCVFAAKWIAENAKRWNGDASRMAIGGDSAGGNLTAATLLYLGANSAGPRFKVGALIYACFDFPAWLAKGNGFELAAQRYLGASYSAALTDPRVSPRRWLKQAALPPCVLIVGSSDDLVAESIAMSEAMKRVNIEHELHVVDQMPHAFLQMRELSGCKQGFRLIDDFFQRHL
jgi:acetyl esterase